MKFLLALALPLYALDQATKWWVVTHLRFGSDWPPTDPAAHVAVWPEHFYFVYWANTGAAFSMFRDNNTFFIVLSLATLAGLLIATARGTFRDAWSRCGVGLLVAGILGNVTDRLIHQHVVDFLLVDLHIPFANPWPAFNVADSCICIAVACFLIATIFEGKKTASGGA
jgi:signal peptidase II